jgi:HrpA-like RNA helicase
MGKNANYTDYLDAQARRRNFLTRKAYSDDYRKLSQVWRKLPMYTRDAVKDMIESFAKNQVTILVAGTGSGKTVISPKLMLRFLHEKSKTSRVVVTNPKRLTTRANAERDARFLDVTLGREVGYVYRASEDGSWDESRTRLLFSTDGWLLQQAQNTDPTLGAFDGIIIDEVHERPVNVDLLLGYVIRALKVRSRLRLLVISATLDVNMFSDYFRDFDVGIVQASGAPNMPIDHRYLSAAPAIKDVQASISNVLTSVLPELERDQHVVVFVPVTSDAKTGCSFVVGKQTAGGEILCLPVYAGMPEEQRELATNPVLYKSVAPQASRKILFATNVAESSLTIPDVYCVIDTGLELKSAWDAEIGGARVGKARITKAQAKQRAGRTGRTGPGIVLHMYSKAEHEAMVDFPAPAILQTDLSSHVLDMLSSGTIATCLDFVQSLITRPRTSQIMSELHALHFAEYVSFRVPTTVTLDDEVTTALKADRIAWCDVDWTRMSIAVLRRMSVKVTPLGSAVSSCPSLSAPNAALVVWGEALGVADDVRVLACLFEDMASSRSAPWKRDALGTVERVTPATFQDIADASGDHATLINVYRRWYLRGRTERLHVPAWDRVHAAAVALGAAPPLTRSPLRAKLRAAADAMLPRVRSPLVRCIVMARLSHVFTYDAKSSRARNHHAFSPTTNATLVPMCSVPSPGKWGVYENLVVRTGRPEFSCITVVKESSTSAPPIVQKSEWLARAALAYLPSRQVRR